MLLEIAGQYYYHNVTCITIYLSEHCQYLGKKLLLEMSYLRPKLSYCTLYKKKRLNLKVGAVKLKNVSCIFEQIYIYEFYVILFLNIYHNPFCMFSSTPIFPITFWHPINMIFMRSHAVNIFMLNNLKRFLK